MGTLMHRKCRLLRDLLVALSFVTGCHGPRARDGAPRPSVRQSATDTRSTPKTSRYQKLMETGRLGQDSFALHFDENGNLICQDPAFLSLYGPHTCIVDQSGHASCSQPFYEFNDSAYAALRSVDTSPLGENVRFIDQIQPLVRGPNTYFCGRSNIGMLCWLSPYAEDAQEGKLAPVNKPQVVASPVEGESIIQVHSSGRVVTDSFTVFDLILTRSGNAYGSYTRSNLDETSQLQVSYQPAQAPDLGLFEIPPKFKEYLSPNCGKTATGAVECFDICQSSDCAERVRPYSFEVDRGTWAMWREIDKSFLAVALAQDTDWTSVLTKSERHFCGIGNDGVYCGEMASDSAATELRRRVASWRVEADTRMKAAYANDNVCDQPPPMPPSVYQIFDESYYLAVGDDSFMPTPPDIPFSFGSRNIPGWTVDAASGAFRDSSNGCRTLFKMSAPPNATNITYGAAHACLIADGDVFCAGENDYGQRGNGSATNLGYVNLINKTATSLAEAMTFERITRVGRDNSEAVPATERFVDVQATDNRTCALTSTNKLYCWGLNPAPGVAPASGITLSPGYWYAPWPVLVGVAGGF